MRLPKRGERGFTLIELLIVVAILGVLAAVVIPNVTRFFGKGEEEAGRTELQNVSLAVTAMMVDNGITAIPNPVPAATDVMGEFPDTTSDETTGTGNDKVTDPKGVIYDFDAAANADKRGYRLYGHDITGGAVDDSVVSYINMATSEYKYKCDPDGTVHQYMDDGITEITY